MRLRLLAAVAACAALALSQSRTMTEGAHRMELTLERLDGDAWHSVDPALVLAQGDRVRFRFRTNFDGYLYVMNQSTSGKYEQLFPREETGDRTTKSRPAQEYQVPSTSTAFRIAGPAGYESGLLAGDPGEPHRCPAPLGRAARRRGREAAGLDSALRRHHDGGARRLHRSRRRPKLVPRGELVPQNLAGPAEAAQRDLLFMRQKDTAVISSPAPLTGPVIYEFRLAHR